MSDSSIFGFFGFFGILAFIVPLVITGLVIYFVFVPIYRNMREKQRVASTGITERAVVIDCSQTGVTINQTPQMRVVFDIESPGFPPRRVETRQLIDLGRMPRAGDLCYVKTDPTDPNNVVFAGIIPAPRA